MPFVLFLGIYASGPQAHMIRGVVEQNYIFHVMDYALCLSESKSSICEREGLTKENAAASAYQRLIYIHIFTVAALLMNTIA